MKSKGVFISKEMEFIIGGGPGEEYVCHHDLSISTYMIHSLPLSFYNVFGPQLFNIRSVTLN